MSNSPRPRVLADVGGWVRDRDRKALLEVTELLEAGDLVAGLDVFDRESLAADSPLRRLSNTFITPHIAWYAPNALRRCFASMAEEFCRYFTGQELQQGLTQRMVDIRHGRL